MKKCLAVLYALLLFLTAGAAAEDGSEYYLMTEINEQKNIVQYIYTDENNQIVTGPNEYAIIECQYEGRKEYPFKVRYLNESGERVNNPDGYSVVKYNYDGWKRLSEATFYGTDGKIINTIYGYAHVYIRYEADGMDRAVFYTSNKMLLHDDEGELYGSIYSWVSKEGKPVLPFENCPLNMDWNLSPTPAPEEQVRGYVITTVEVNLRREPRYSNIMRKVPADTVLPWYEKVEAANGVTWYCVLDPEKGKVIVCHLGNGASICAVDGGKSVETSMGLTPLMGLIMGTRSGEIDPGAMEFIAKKEGLDLEGIMNVLNKKSGMLGLSGLSSDFRDIDEAIAAGNEQAKAAYDAFIHRVAYYVGGYAAVMNGVDAVLFTGGIGENSWEVRESVCENMDFFGIKIDKELNRSIRGKLTKLSTPDSKVDVWIVPTNEELLIARDTLALISQ